MITAAGSEPGPAASAQTRLSAPDAPTAVAAVAAVAAARANTAGVWATAAKPRSGLAVSLAEQPVRFSGEFLAAAVMLGSGHCSMYPVAPAQRVIPHARR
jgi:hypothetical protein